MMRVGLGSALLWLCWAAGGAVAWADAHEASLSLQAAGAAVHLEDPDIPGGADVTAAGASVRFTWASRDWLAWQLGGYGLTTTSASYSDVMIAGAASDTARGTTLAGVEAGATLRLGARFIPTLTVAVGPQLRLFPSAAVTDSQTNLELGSLAGRSEFDLTARLGAGFDYRMSARWIIGARASVRQSLGIATGSARTAGVMLHASYYWYPRWWTF